MHRAVFIDRDGVICRNWDDYVKSWPEFVFVPGALKSLARLARLRLPIIVVTADDDLATRHKAQQLKASAFFHKPVDGSALLDAIDWALRSNP